MDPMSTETHPPNANDDPLPQKYLMVCNSSLTFERLRWLSYSVNYIVWEIFGALIPVKVKTLRGLDNHHYQRKEHYNIVVCHQHVDYKVSRS